jgi:hypothetical protein
MLHSMARQDLNLVCLYKIVKETVSHLSNRPDGLIVIVIGINASLVFIIPAQAGIQFSCPS